MGPLGDVFSALFWGVLLLSFLVIIHEGGHFLAARLFHVRVTEFMLGMPCPIKLSRTSNKYGTEFGVTPLLLGGYNRICGLDAEPAPGADRVLACVNRHGKVTVSEVAQECGITPDEAQDLLISLSGWASVKPFYSPELGERPNQRYYPQTWMTPKRDGSGRTVYDKDHDFTLAGSAEEGEPFEIHATSRDFYDAERSHTYAGLTFWKKCVVLLAGVVINILFGILLYASVLSIVGVEAPADINTVGSVVAESSAEAAGILPGDSILSVNGTPCSTWTEVSGALATAREGSGTADVVIERDGSQQEVSLALREGDDYFGVNCSTEMVPLPFDVSLKISLNLTARVFNAIIQLFIPAKTIQVLEQSSSVVGVSVVASQAVQEDFSIYLYLIASVSLSLGFMNLIPIPLLDGGKLLIEAIQALARRKLPKAVLTGWSYVGLFLLLGLFVYTLRADIIRLATGTLVLG